MGAWGTGPFDNDDAADWFLELEELDDSHQLLLETLDAVDGDADAIDASRAVAAIGWLLSGLHDSLDARTVTHVAPPKLTAATRWAATRAIDQMLGQESEWRNLWEDAGEDEPIRQLKTYRTVLGALGPG